MPDCGTLPGLRVAGLTARREGHDDGAMARKSAHSSGRARGRAPAAGPAPAAAAAAAAEPTAPGLRWWLAWRPQVLVFVAAGALFTFALLRASEAAIWAWWADSYRVVEWEMVELGDGQAWPLVHGRVAGSGLELSLEGQRIGDQVVLVELPQQAFTPGRRVPLWLSGEAPMQKIQGHWTNHVPVAALPQRPGWLHVAGWLGLAVATVWLARRMIMWVAARMSLQAGDPRLRRRTLLED